VALEPTTVFVDGAVTSAARTSDLGPWYRPVITAEHEVVNDSQVMVPCEATLSASADCVRVVTDTGELRWFAHGRLPADVLRWFDHSGLSAAIERRSDTYRVDTRADIGLKLRSGEMLELKVLQSVQEVTLELSASMTGRLETWRRWSPADGLVELEPADEWIDVVKTITKRRFRHDGAEVAVEPELPDGGCCDIELAELVVGESHWWTMGLTASTAPVSQPDLMRVAWDSASSVTSPPSAVTSALGRAQGYPAWLAGHRQGALECDSAFADGSGA
jgi:hypothetical protein